MAQNNMENKECAVLRDLRESVLGDNKPKEWNQWNILYRTLWFAHNKKVNVELCEAAKELYATYFRYEYRMTEKETSITIANTKGVRLTADIMNGWWGPFRLLLDNNIKYNKNRAGIIKTLMKALGNCSTDNNEELIAKLLSKKIFTISKKEDYFSLFEFLKVVYTIGNMTPTVVNTRADDLDSWEYKLKTHVLPWTRILYESEADASAAMKKFCQENYYEDYIDGDDVKNLTVNDVRENPNEYFSNRVEKIVWRGYRIMNKEVESVDSDKKQVIITELRKKLISM